MAKQVMKLNMTATQDGFFTGTSLVGIVSAMPGYHLCWLINRYFDIDFARDPGLNQPLQKKENSYYFPVYQYHIPASNYKYLLYQLKNGKESLLPETGQLDYLWLIQTGSPVKDAEDIAAGLRNIPEVQLARILDRTQLKNIDNLLV